MLQEIIDLQQKAVVDLISALDTKRKDIFFKAPTGSGKTYMMADFMSRVLSKNHHITFIVSSLSKGDLARQNYEKFVKYKDCGDFTNLEPYLINSDIAGEERIYIPPEHNVYVLPRDLYKSGGRLMQGAMPNFLLELTMSREKEIILIRDECHIATKNLDDISGYFRQTVNFSATPKLSRGQHPDVEIKVEDAVNCKLIKTVKWGDSADTVADAIKKFEEVKEDYRNDLGVNPCLIIQISNKDKAEEELSNTIMPVLNKSSLKWMLIVNKDTQCDTNDVFKAKKIPVPKWKDYAKLDDAVIDVIIFKMVITEGWDIPRACMLYQVRDTKSKQLDEQVIGRVRRNPRLLDFDTLPSKAQELAMTAWVWGVVNDERKKIYGVKLHDDAADITDNIRIKTTKLKKLTDKTDFNIVDFLKNKRKPTVSSSIFELAKKIKQSGNEVRELIYSYASDYTKWFEAAECTADIAAQNARYKNDYAQSMEVGDTDVSFALSSYYTDSGGHKEIDDWVWKRRDDETMFSFDSDAESLWADILKELSQRARLKSINTGKIKKNKLAGEKNLWGETEADETTDEKEIFLWGKNYVPNSVIKFEYYMGAVHSSFPDFVMKDKFGRVHIFEVKSVNRSDKYTFDNNLYEEKIAELKKCYIQASALTGQIFYFPVLDGSTWKITRFYDGGEETLTKKQFIDFVTKGEL